LVGFAAELGGGATLEARAASKLREKGCDAIVANDVSAPGIGFDADDNAVTVMFADGSRVDIPRASKRAVAEQLWSLFASRLPPKGSQNGKDVGKDDGTQDGKQDGQEKEARQSGHA
jgi:phosphopantothenoylcysteine decarboxylase/phosphopantothenate--cysteine ligase